MHEKFDLWNTSWTFAEYSTGAVEYLTQVAHNSNLPNLIVSNLAQFFVKFRKYTYSVKFQNAITDRKTNQRTSDEKISEDCTILWFSISQSLQKYSFVMRSWIRRSLFLKFHDAICRGESELWHCRDQLTTLYLKVNKTKTNWRSRMN